MGTAVPGSTPYYKKSALKKRVIDSNFSSTSFRMDPPTQTYTRNEAAEAASLHGHTEHMQSKKSNLLG